MSDSTIGDLKSMLHRYDPGKLSLGWNYVDGEEIFFISNPGLGLWAHRSRLKGEHMNTLVCNFGKFSIGTGDRFAHQAKAQLQACILAAEGGVEVIPVWNKSNREHTIIGSEPASTRQAADAAVKALGWKHPCFLDADHINLNTFDRFLAACDFYTIDVADYIGQPAARQHRAFVHRHPSLLGRIQFEGIDRTLHHRR